MALSAETVLDADIVLVETVLGVEETEGIVLENVKTVSASAGVMEEETKSRLSLLPILSS